MWAVRYQDVGVSSASPTWVQASKDLEQNHAIYSGKGYKGWANKTATEILLGEKRCSCYTKSWKQDKGNGI